MVISTDVTQPTPTPTPGTTGSLEPVGLIPLADGGSDDLNMFYAKVFRVLDLSVPRYLPEFPLSSRNKFGLEVVGRVIYL